MSRRRGICPVCHQTVGVRKDGFIRAHGYLKGSDETIPCAGTDKEPKEGVNGAYSALCMDADCANQTTAIVWTGHAWESLCATHALEALS